MSVTLNGIMLRFTISIVLTPAISEVAIKTPATGETVLPIEAARFMGKIMLMLLTPNCLANFGIRGAKAKKEALPLPINMEAKKIITAMTIPIPTPPQPKL